MFASGKSFRALQILIRYMRFIAMGFYSVPILICIRLIRPFLLIRIGFFDSTRIGHYSTEIALRTAQQQLKLTKSIDIYYIRQGSVNQYMDKLASRKFIIAPRFILHGLFLWNNYLPLKQLHTVSTFEVDNFLSCQKATKLELFTNKENQIAKNWLLTHGWNGERIICLQVRDSSYLDNHYISKDWSYHSYRDCDIQSFRKATEWLNKMNFFVIRMGSICNQRMNFSNNLFLDYAFDSLRSDFMDVWLFANCDACISTGSGLDFWSALNKKPLLFVNLIPLRDIHTTSSIMIAPQKLYWHDTFKPLTIDECFMQNYSRTSDFTDNNILLRRLSEFEIFQIVKEFYSCYLNKHSSNNINNKSPGRTELVRCTKAYLLKDKSIILPSENSLLSEEWIQMQNHNTF